MGLDKSIEYGKEHRRKYFGSKAVDKTCRNHGSCEWCRENRLHKYKKTEHIRTEEISMDNYEKNIEAIAIYLLNKCCSTEYSEALYRMIAEDVKDDVIECSGLMSGEGFGDTDVKYAIGRSILRRLGCNV